MFAETTVYTARHGYIVVRYGRLERVHATQPAVQLVEGVGYLCCSAVLSALDETPARKLEIGVSTYSESNTQSPARWRAALAAIDAAAHLCNTTSSPPGSQFRG
jgi:hypothetical protein